MIKLVQKSKDEFEFTLNGKVVDKTTVRLRKDKESGNDFFEIHSKNEKFFEQIRELSLNDFPPLFYLNFEIDLIWLNSGIYPTIWFITNETSKNNEDKSFEIALDYHTNLYDWRSNYTFYNYFDELKKVTDESKVIKVQTHDNNGDLDYGFLVKQVDRVPGNSQISKVLNEFLSNLKDTNFKVVQNLTSFSSQHLLNTSFDFPEEIKFFCEQYLLYFAQFLRDLGINATSNIKEEAGKVLFSVTSTDDVEALDKIRAALAVYLHLPSSPIVYDESFAAMRQKQQIENLQHSQKMIEMEFRLSQKVIESQDKIIRQKDTLIEQQNDIIEKIRNKSVMIDSAENKEELEEIFEGVKIGKSKFLAEQLGLHLNPATALKTVGKKILGQTDENKSVLGLDEKD